MPSIQFQPVLREIREVLGSDYYVIPRFQRPYSWNSENLDDFWRDVILDNDAGYFIGPMVAFNESSSRVGIVDGQQRLTSIMLALAAIRDLFIDLNDDSLAQGMQRYIERADDDNFIHYVLQSGASKEYFSSQFLTPPPRQLVRPSTLEHRNLSRASSEISKWLDQQIDGFSRVRQRDGEPTPAGSKLREIRDKILSLQVIWIRLDEEDDAYIVFETLNSRGKDLEVIDLLKNLLFNYVRQENADLDSTRTAWEEMRTVLDEKGGSANPNKFILHWWLSQFEYTAERKLFSKIRKRIEKPSAPALVTSLRRDATHYTHITNPSDWIPAKGSPGNEVRASFSALNIFAVSQPRPMLLAILRAWRDGHLKYSTVKRIVFTIENFHFVTTAVVGVSSTGGVSEMYAKHARELTGSKTASGRSDAIEGLVKKLTNSARIPSREAFISEFLRSMRYSATEPSQKRLVQYTLMKLQDYSRPGIALDHGKCNIEHISNQSDAEPWMPSIGNLVWIEANVNTLLGSKSFTDKKQVLRKYAQIYDLTAIVQADNWSETEVEARAVAMAEQAFDHVWRLK